MVKLTHLGPTYTLYKTHIHPMFPTPQALFNCYPGLSVVYNGNPTHIGEGQNGHEMNSYVEPHNPSEAQSTTHYAFIRPVPVRGEVRRVFLTRPVEFWMT